MECSGIEDYCYSHITLVSAGAAATLKHPYGPHVYKQ